ncbi:hypothetical protein BaRGS_00016663 [Batillaria attramentaria]|uniref:RING-type domain-containing protein n=1 Tax=Batillaria attramentaria TaxID=370345 RepID=A0ABD0KXQ0_9CAEN
MGKKRRSRRKQNGKNTQPSTSENGKAAHVSAGETRFYCAVCSEQTKSVNLLQCSHKLCQKCLDGIVKSGDADTFTCPACPQNSVSDNVTLFIQKVKNLFLSPNAATTGGTKCLIHSDQNVHFLCITCYKIICPVCKLSEHEGHETASLRLAAASAKDRIQDASNGRLEDYAAGLRSAIEDVSENQKKLTATRQIAEDIIWARHAKLQALVNKCCDSALLELEAMAVEVKCKLQEDLSNLQQELALVSRTQQHAEEVLTGEDDFESLFNLDRLLASEWSTKHITQQQINLFPTFTYSLEHTIGTDTNTDGQKSGETEQEDMKVCMQSFIGRTIKLETPKPQSTPGVKVTPAFRCSDDPGAFVVSVCPVGDSKLAVSFETTAKDVSGLKGHTRSFFEDGCPSKSFDFGLCTLVRRGGHGYFLYLPVQGRQNIFWKKVTCLFSKSGKDYLLVHADGQCSLWPFANRVYFWPLLRTYFSNPESVIVLNDVLPPLSFDIADSGKLFALTDCEKGDTKGEGKEALGITQARTLYACYTAGVNVEGCEDTRTIAVQGPPYKPPVKGFLPSDVCFFNLHGREVLLVTDMANHTIHVVNIDPTSALCTFERFLVSDCPMMQYPTALNTDQSGRLWVACKGGKLLIVEPGW